jgi:SH3-like domain-containing protein
MMVETATERFHYGARKTPNSRPVRNSIAKLQRILISAASRRRVARRNMLALVACLAVIPIAVTAQIPPVEKLPRFASLRSDDVNLRVGPGENYPIEWVLKRKEMPVQVLEQFQNWRRVQDWQGDKGWLLDRMITGKRAVIVDGNVRVLHRQPDPASPAVARAEPGVIARLIDLKGAWCRVDAGGYRGWVLRSEVWGVFPDENLQ